MLKYAYNSDQWHFKCKVAFLFILGHLVILILPFFSVIFLLMEVLGEGSNQGSSTKLDDPYEGLALCTILILLIGTFFSEMITLFGKPFSTLVTVEVILLVTYFFLTDEYSCRGPSSTRIPLGVISFCTFIKLGCAYWSQNMEKAKNYLIKKGPGKIV